ncbi:MAG TPA: 6-phosphogluconolactonase [Thermoanaerobaculia bacterium]|nr:6-phosphogluconolactonase [Thermoanaerobaculia bacterium]
MTAGRVGVEVLAGPEELAEAAAARFAAAVEEAVASVGEGGRVSLALAGGSTPRGLYRRLALEPYAARLPWARLHVFWGDERCVPPDDEASNYRMAHETLLSRVAVDPEKVHPIRGEEGATTAARAYEDEIRASLGDEPRLDLVLLGLGDDGHTASLFPAALEGVEGDPHPDRLAAPAEAPSEPKERVTLTLSTLNAARRVLFLVQGAGKAEAVAATFAGTGLASTAVPAARVRPVAGHVLWLLDETAAAGLPERGAR